LWSWNGFANRFAEVYGSAALIGLTNIKGEPSKQERLKYRSNLVTNQGSNHEQEAPSLYLALA
jgi:hypothetical protein